MIHDPAAFASPPTIDWLERSPVLDEQRGGRGQVRRVRTDAGIAVHRHYQRGGRVATVLGDRYWFSGFERSRAALEFRLLADLRQRGLRVPHPLLARVRRQGLIYRADLLTAEIDAATSLAAMLTQAPQDIPWAAVAGTIADIHHAGVWHADLNAHNLLVDAQGQVWIIDFDRAETRAPRLTWREANLERLERSLLKLKADRHLTRFETLWHDFLDQYASAFAQRKREHLT